VSVQIVFHIGAHATDGERLLRTLLKNRETLAAAGVCVPGPARYRGLLHEVLLKLRGQRASTDTQAMLVDELTEGTAARRVVLSYDSLICGPNNIFEGGRLYGRFADKPAWLADLFPDHDVSFALALRNPATFVSAAHALTRDKTLDEFLSGADPMRLSWAQAVHNLTRAVPEAALTVWCNEDAPVLWPEIVCALAGMDAMTPLRGAFEPLADLMARDGLLALRAALAETPPRTAAERRALMADHLEAHALPGVLDEEVRLPGWTDAHVTRVSADYDADLMRLSRLPGVRVLLP
jgi:hypothetical protein